MKKTIALLAGVAALSACSGGSDTAEGETVAEAEAEADLAPLPNGAPGYPGLAEADVTTEDEYAGPLSSFATSDDPAQVVDTYLETFAASDEFTLNTINIEAGGTGFDAPYTLYVARMGEGARGNLTSPTDPRELDLETEFGQGLPVYTNVTEGSVEPYDPGDGNYILRFDTDDTVDAVYRFYRDALSEASEITSTRVSTRRGDDYGATVTVTPGEGGGSTVAVRMPPEEE